MISSDLLKVSLDRISPVVAFDVEFIRGPKIFVTKKPKFLHLPVRVGVVDLIDDTKRICYHSYVKPYADVTDYHTPVTGLRAGADTDELLDKAPSFDEVKDHLQTIFQNRTIVVMDGRQDFDSFLLDKAKYQIVDIGKHLVDEKGFRISLRRLVHGLYQNDLHLSEFHDPSEDAYWTLRLFFDHVYEKQAKRYKKIVVDVPKVGKVDWHSRYKELTDELVEMQLK